MSFFNGHNKKKYTIIVGCGRLGAHLASTLSDKGEDILIIDKDNASFRKLSSSFGGIALQGDAEEMLMRGECDIDAAESVISVTNHDNTNIMIAQIAKEKYKVPHVIARLYDPAHECVYHELGIDTICPVVLSTQEVYSILHKEMAV